MRSKLFLGTAIGLLLPSMVMAADLPSRIAPIAPAAAAPLFTWTGFYIGATIGVASLRSETNDEWLQAYTSGFKEKNSGSGVLAGVTVGYNQQFGRLVAGVEADYSFSSARNKSAGSKQIFYSSGSIVGFTAKSQLSSFGTVRARLGYAVDRSLFYVTGGVAFANIKSELQFADLDASAGCGANFKKSSKTGWVVGAGFEHALSNKVTFKLEGLYADFGNVRVGNTCGCNSSFKNSGFIARAGANYKF